MKKFLLLASLSLSAFCLPASAQAAPAAKTEAPNPEINLCLNPSFEEATPGLTDEDSLPGWKLQFRPRHEDPALAPAEAAVIDNATEANSGSHYLRLVPKDRTFTIHGAQNPEFGPGLYEGSVWAKRNDGDKPYAEYADVPDHHMGGGLGVASLNINKNFLYMSDRWDRYGQIVFTKGVKNFPWVDQTTLQVNVAQNCHVDLDDMSLVCLTSGLADAFGDHMVLQRDRPVPVWGWAKNPDQEITVKFNGQTETTKADKDGRWKVTFKPMKAGGPYILEVNGRPAAYDVMVGDVWICSGQSNMEFGLDLVEHGINGHSPDTLAKANNPMMRLWIAPKQISATPQHDYFTKLGDPNRPFGAQWLVCNPETAQRGVWFGFSAVGYFFGKEIQEDQKVAVGLMVVANGGTQIESFMSPESLKKVPQDQWTVPLMTDADFKRDDTLPKIALDADVTSQAYSEAIARYTAPYGNQAGVDYNHDFQHPYIVYNSLLSPVFPMAVKGAIWYQGEHNGGDPHYEAKLTAMIEDWRARFGDKDMPFIIAQLCNWAGAPMMPAREGELKVAQTVPHTGLAVTADLYDKPGDGYGPNEIHPKNKFDVGHRMALSARAVAYGEKLVYSGPLYTGMKVEGGKIRLKFDLFGSSLVAKGGKLIRFTIAGDDKKFVDADAVIDGNDVVVSAASVPNPASVRYLYEQNLDPMGTLYNKDDLPASPFRTDTW